MSVQDLALYLSIIMSVILFAYAYAEGIKIANTDGNVRAGGFLLSLILAFVFAYYANEFTTSTNI